jgi:hypothetical protein
MEHGFQMVDILNKTGAIIGQKPRRDIDKTKDIYHTVFVFLVTPDKHMVLGQIPAREDLPNLYANQYGATAATIRRSDETPEHAAARAVERELFIDDADLRQIGESLEEFDKLKKLVSVFVLRSEMPDSFSLMDIKALKPMTRSDIDAWMQKKPGKLAPTLRLVWQKYGERFPV